MSVSDEITVKEPSKVILFGEHFVVHGGIALAFPINCFTEVHLHKSSNFTLRLIDEYGKIYAYNRESKNDLVIFIKYLCRELAIDDNITITIRLNYPISAGLGSSASMAVAITKALLKFRDNHSLLTDKGSIFNLAKKLEELVHRKPSGIDLTTILEKKIILYDGSKRKAIDYIEYFNYNDVDFIVADTLDRRSTGKIVSRVTKIKEKFNDIFEKLIELSSDISIRGFNILRRNESIENIGDLMNINQGLLEAIGVSTEKIRSLISTALLNDALGAKITGAGGGGCILILAYRRNTPLIVNKLKERGAKVLVVRPYIEV